MTKPTQAQIEAAAESMHRYDVEHGLDIDGLASAENYWPIAKAALTAAAEVGEPFSKEGYDALPAYDPETIERCAQIVLQWLDTPYVQNGVIRDIATAIRKRNNER